MCGIAGTLSFTAAAEPFLSAIDSVTDAMISRGPDGRGVYRHSKCALGQRRLSIIDTSNAAAQPFTDESGRYTIVFNGEIFNFHTLREQAESRGHRLRSQGDTEALLYHLIDHGLDGLTQVNGEFAFALYDAQLGSLTLVRDRFGIKPLYYRLDEESLIFASELKALRRFPFEKKLNKAALMAYFHLNYIPSPLSIYEGVQKLLPGHWMRISADGQQQSGAYYQLEKEPKQPIPSYETATAEIRRLLTSSVRDRMIADVPLGTFLSGGIDSSIVTAIASRETKHLQSFSIGFADEPLFDETEYARMMARHLGTEHNVFSLTNNDLYAHLHSMLDSIDEPFADSSALAVYILSHETRKQVTVSLSGDGADEIFAGYNKHAAEWRIRSQHWSNALLGHSGFLLPLLPKSRNSKWGNKGRQLEKYIRGLQMTHAERYWQWARWAGLTEQGLLRNEYRDEKAYQQYKNEWLKNCRDDYNDLLWTDMRLVLENDMLVKADRMSMANSLEVRVPFLDHALVDYAFQLPAEYKINSGIRKRVLKDAFRDMLPEALFHRGKKGFEVPLLGWFRGELKSLITDELLSKSFIEEQGLFHYPLIEEVKNKLFSASPNDAVEQCWALLVFQYWWKKHWLSTDGSQSF